MAENTRESFDQSRNTDGHPLHFSSLSLEHDADKEARLRTFKERQNEERQKKLEEIKAQALAAQRFKEQKEQERRRRLDEMRLKDDSRRHQVEERKRAINDAERDRLESIIRRNQEREARIETRKRHERSNIVFAFGSSTPRMLDTTDASLSYWGQRRATSIQNITSTATPSNLTRRQSERDLDAASKKRATSAGGSDRPESLSSPTIPAGCASGYLGRRRTDLVPTIPSKDSSFHSSASRKSLNHSPGRAYSMSRLDQLAKPRKPLLPALNESNMSPKSSMTRSMGHLAHVGSAKLSPRKPLNKIDSRSMHHLSPDGPVAPPRVNRATQLRKERLLAQQSGSTSEASSRPSSSMSQQSTNSVTSSVNVRHRISNTPRRPRPASIAVTGVTNEIKNSFDREHKPPLPKTRKPLSKTNTSEKIEKAKRPLKSPAEETAPKIVGEDRKEVKKEVKEKKEVEEVIKLPRENGHKESEKEVEPVEPVKSVEPVQTKEPTPQILVDVKEEPVHHVQEEAPRPQIPKVIETQLQQNEPSKDEGDIIQNFINNERNASEDASHKTGESVAQSQTTTTIMTSSVTETKEIKPENGESNEMTLSMSKPRINTEEEAKAALAERRRLMREETERQAELERQRIEAEQKAEFEKQQKEEEQARLLAEMQRKAEQERLQEAIKEVQKREEEERLRKEEELRQKVLKEEADKKAKEEAERQKAELQKKLENEEKEREERRKRVEMIMSRTRGKANANLASQQNSQDRNENTSDSKQQVNDIEFNEDNQVNENKLNGTKKENGTNESSATQNGKGVDSGIVDNIIPDQSVNANTVADTINTDSLNSNSAWQTSSQQYDTLT